MTAPRSTLVPALMMLTASLCWGASYLFMQKSLAEVGPCSLIVWRFGIAFVFSALLFPRTLFSATKAEWKHGLLLGVLLGIAFYAVMIGLRGTTTGNAGFLLGCTSVFVPLLCALKSRKWTLRILLAAAVSVSGIGLMTLQSGFRLRPGDLFCMLSALLYSFYIILAGGFLRNDNPLRIGVIQFSGAATAAGAGALISGETAFLPSTLPVWGEILFLGIFCSAAGFMLQMSAQKKLSPEYVSLLYSSEPVFAMILGLIFLAEPLSAGRLGGAALILCGILLSSLRRK